jgi:uncharacterized protein
MKPSGGRSSRKTDPATAERLGRRLFRAVDKGDLNLARELLEEGADVNYTEPKKGSSPLIRAVARKRGVDFLKLLVNRGADVNYRAPLAGTPLLNAVGANDLAAFKYLVSCGADVFQRGDAGNLLHNACAQGFIDLAKELIRLGVDVEAMNVIGQTALTQAVSIERLDIVKLLLKAGASPHSGACKEVTAADWAGEFGSREMRKLLGIPGEPTGPA